MKTFSQLRRDIKEGTTIKTILNSYKQDKNGQIRKVAKVQTNAIGFEIPKEEQHTNIFGEMQTISWLWWGNAKQYEYENNIFKIYDFINGEKKLSFIYEIINK